MKKSLTLSFLLMFVLCSFTGNSMTESIELSSETKEISNPTPVEKKKAKMRAHKKKKKLRLKNKKKKDIRQKQSNSIVDVVIIVGSILFLIIGGFMFGFGIATLALWITGLMLMLLGTIAGTIFSSFIVLQNQDVIRGVGGLLGLIFILGIDLILGLFFLILGLNILNPVGWITGLILLAIVIVFAILFLILLIKEK